jgi:lipid A ethanolaminephosphotransferase
MINPINPVLSAASVALDPILNKPRPLSVSRVAQLWVPAMPQPRNRRCWFWWLARRHAQNFSLNGYERDTNPSWPSAMC